jgi:riboflavin synthase
MDFRIPEAIFRQTIPHGSIALNGVSLTVNALTEPDRVQVGIISFTWEHTNLSRLRPGSPVNVEGDLIGKYVGRLLERNDSAADADAEASGDREPGGDPGATN